MNLTEDEIYRFVRLNGRTLRKNGIRITEVQSETCSKALLEKRLAQIHMSDEEKIELIKNMNNVMLKVAIIQTISDKNHMKQAIQESNISDELLVKTLAIDLKNTVTANQIIHTVENDKIRTEVGQLLDERFESQKHFLEQTGLKRKVIDKIIVSEANKEHRGNIPEPIMKIATEELGIDLSKERSDYEKIGINEQVIEREQAHAEFGDGIFDEMEKQYLNNVRADYDHPRRISMGNVKGTLCMNEKEGTNADLGECSWKTLWETLKRSDTYMEKALSGEYQFGKEEMERLNKEEAIKLVGKGSQLYVRGNGNHRMTFLKLKYLSEREEAKGDPEKLREVEEKYTYDIESVREVPEDIKELVNMNVLLELQEVTKKQTDLHELVKEGKKIGYRIEGENVELIGTEEIEQYVQEKMRNLQTENIDQYNEVIHNLTTNMSKTDRKEEYLAVLQQIQEQMEEKKKETDRKQNNQLEIEEETIEHEETLSEEIHDEEQDNQPEIEESSDKAIDTEIQQKKGIWNRLKEKVQNSKIFKKIMRKDEVKRLPEATMKKEIEPRKTNKPEWDLQNYGMTKEEFNRKVEKVRAQKEEEQNQEEHYEQKRREEEQL